MCDIGNRTSVSEARGGGDADVGEADWVASAGGKDFAGGEGWAGGEGEVAMDGAGLAVGADLGVGASVTGSGAWTGAAAGLMGMVDWACDCRCAWSRAAMRVAVASLLWPLGERSAGWAPLGE